MARSPEFVCIGRSKGEIHYTTREMLGLEKKLLGEVAAPNGRPAKALPEKTVRAAEGKLSDEQKEALRHVTQAGGSIHVVSGMAGTGKASMLRAMREARDARLAAPLLLLPSIQTNIRAGKLPPAEANGVTYFKIPVKLVT